MAGWLRRFAEARGLEWPDWAAQHGWRYDETRPDLAGRWLEEPTGRRQGREYLGTVEGELHGLRFTCFTCREWGAPGNGQADIDYVTHLAVELPHAVAPTVLQMFPAEAFRALGGSLVGPLRFEWRGDRTLFGTATRLVPVQVEQTLEQIGAQVATAPPEVWQSA